jgi:hypothetical protein
MRMHQLRSALLEAADPPTVRAVLLKLGELALEGDVLAAKLYLEYTCGKPKQPVEAAHGGYDLESDREEFARIVAALGAASTRCPLPAG